MYHLTFVVPLIAGKGNFGSVLKGTCMANGQLIPVAVKTLKADFGIPNSEVSSKKNILKISKKSKK